MLFWRMLMNIEITNPNKILYPKDKIKKIDLINYYIDISDNMLPFIENRLLSVIRCHNNIEGECFYKKHIGNDKEVNIYKDKEDEYFYIKNREELIYQIQMGTIEFHVGSSKVDRINKPDIMVFDLDPDEMLPFDKLIDAILKIKSILDELQLKSFLKTSGGKGYHIFIPFSSSKNFDSFYNFAKQVALLAESKWPKLFTANIKKAERKGKVFIDYLRNNKSSTCVAPFSLRAREGAGISYPIQWEMLKNIKPNQITIKNYKDYDRNVWKEFFEINQKIK